MTSLERRPDELWTSYLVRRLRAEGFSPTEQDFEETDKLRTYDGGVLELRVTVDTNESLIEIQRKVLDLERSLRENSTYFELRRDLFEEWWEESVVVTQKGKPSEYTWLVFKEDGLVTVLEDSENNPHPTLSKYQPGTTWNAEECIDDLIHYIQSVGYQEELVGEEPDSRDASPRMETKRSSSATLDVLSEGEHLSRLYVEAINRDAHNQRFFEYRDKRIFYVLVDSSDIGGNVGKPFHNLYFVARDLAPEDWQQKIVAFHESQCLHFGSHEAAKAKEPRLARFLGKEQEYLVWREQIDNGKLGCQGREDD